MMRIIFTFLLLIMFTIVAYPQPLAYDQTFRPQYHFSPQKNWINDPCGTVHHNGLYHLMYQYNPSGAQWGNMSWGHAVSPDLVHWEEMPVALTPDGHGAIFTGSAVIDKNNTAGFGKDAMVAIFTHAGTTQSQSLAYSVDNGVTWTKFNDNPVLPNPGVSDFRDPQVFWHVETSRWVMTLAVKDRIQIFTSPDLKHWTHTSDFGETIGAHGGVWECPDLFSLQVEGSEEMKWVMIVSLNPGGPAGGSGMQYFVGDFDGETFVADEKMLRILQPTIPPGTLFEDFESGYRNWQVSGNAFGAGPVQGTLPGQQVVQGFAGSHLVNSYLNGDAPQGKIRSIEFRVNSDYINFLLGGGNHPGLAEIRLIVNNEIVMRSTGMNEERLRWQGWNVAEYRGENAMIEIVDEVSGGWGHINVDHILFSEERAVNNTPEGFWVDYGPDFYAARTWENKPEGEEERVWVSWLSNWAYAGNIPTWPWRGSMSLPRALFLERGNDRYFLRQKPIGALETLRGPVISFSASDIAEANSFLTQNNAGGEKLEISFSMLVPEGEAGLRVRSNGINYSAIGYSRNSQTAFVDRSLTGVQPFGDQFQKIFSTAGLQSGDSVHFHIFLDESTLEVFVNDGDAVISSLIFPFKGADGIEFFQTGQHTQILNFNMWKVYSIWNKPVAEVTSVQSENFRMDVYPNPSSGESWMIDSMRNISRCELYDLKGLIKEIQIKRISPSLIEISTSSRLRTGVYFLKIFDRTGYVTSKKLIVR